MQALVTKLYTRLVHQILDRMNSMLAKHELETRPNKLICFIEIPGFDRNVPDGSFEDFCFAYVREKFSEALTASYSRIHTDQQSAPSLFEDANRKVVHLLDSKSGLLRMIEDESVGGATVRERVEGLKKKIDGVFLEHGNVCRRSCVDGKEFVVIAHSNLQTSFYDLKDFVIKNRNYEEELESVISALALSLEGKSKSE